MPDTHFFNVPLAVKFGQENSVVLSNLCYWIKHNAQNNINFFENRYWTYNTLDAFQKQFPYFTVNQIRTILSNLKKSGAVVTGNFNRRAFDRTLWYSVSDEVFSIYEGNNTAQASGGVDATDAAEPPAPALPDATTPPQRDGKAQAAAERRGDDTAANAAPENRTTAAPICENSQMHLGDSTNAFVENHRPIPDINIFINKDINKESTTTAAVHQNPAHAAAAAAAAVPGIDTLKENFLRIDPALVFDEAFYFKAGSTLVKYGLDNKYLIWLYDFCKKKKPVDLTAYYFSVFREESVINRFIAAAALKPQQPRNVVCPVCNEPHAEFSDCPSCGFSGQHDTKKIAAAKVVFNMPSDVRAAYENELAALIGGVMSFAEQIALMRTIREKYNIPE